MTAASTINTGAGGNRLPVLASEIREAHSGVLDAVKTAAERAIEAGKALLEAKALLKHGTWLPWLKEHCKLTERTAQLYMAIARSGLKSETVADLGLKAASKVEWTIYDTTYDPFHHCDEADVRDWKLYVMFLTNCGKGSVDAAFAHIEWVLQREFKNPDEWLGEEGQSFCRHVGLRTSSTEVCAEWARFKSAHASDPPEEIEAILQGGAR